MATAFEPDQLRVCPETMMLFHPLVTKAKVLAGEQVDGGADDGRTVEDDRQEKEWFNETVDADARPRFRKEVVMALLDVGTAEKVLAFASESEEGEAEEGGSGYEIEWEGRRFPLRLLLGGSDPPPGAAGGEEGPSSPAA